ncbi:TetR/AcrR family transcriptional regulator [Nocardia sp. SYP-A9097]|uniref:TetR family transcriptional regulator n=1 Tax=Nocardia sp. SYP-A9097 TaxID=2663237 RepID=UPI00129B560F
MPDATPTGKDAVVAAVLASAADLFAQRGPAATTVRHIAAQAGVNHGLVFRYFGTKDQLIGAVLDHLGMEMATLQNSGASLEQLDAGFERQWRVLARAILDGFPVGQLQKQFAGMQGLLEHALTLHDDDVTARTALANAVALQLGWRLFEPFLRAAAGIEDVAESDLREAVNTEMARIFRPAHSGPTTI